MSKDTIDTAKLKTIIESCPLSELEHLLSFSLEQNYNGTYMLSVIGLLTVCILEELGYNVETIKKEGTPPSFKVSFPQ